MNKEWFMMPADTEVSLQDFDMDDRDMAMDKALHLIENNYMTGNVYDLATMIAYRAKEAKKAESAEKGEDNE